MEQPISQRVRPMTCDDLERVLTWRNHPDVRRFMYTQHEITLSEHARWFERASQDAKRHCLIFERENRALGFINLHEIAAGGIADWGFYVAPEAPKGTGRQMGASVLRYAFDDLNMHKICGQALNFNERSIQFHLRLGFQQEGVLRDQHFDGQQYHAVMCFGLLAADWQTNREK